MTYLIKSPYINERANVQQFAHSDSEELFTKNKKELGSDWIWHDKEITYKFNRYGYRMKELEEVDFNNYYAFFGCSFGVGIGLPLEETYAYKIAQQANVDYVNASVGGSSIEFAHINFIELFTHAPKLPKKVIINWPEITRTCFWYKDRLEFYLANKINSEPFWEDAYRSFILEESHLTNRFKTIRQSVQTMCDIANVELFEISTYQADPYFYENHRGIQRIKMNPRPVEHTIEFYNQSFARDIHVQKPVPLAHPGIFFQDKVVEACLMS